MLRKLEMKTAAAAVVFVCAAVAGAAASSVPTVEEAAGVPFCMIRLNETARVKTNELFQVFAANAAHPGSADGYWFDIPVWNDLEATRRSFETTRSLREKCVKLDMVFDVQVFTLGHGTIFTDPEVGPGRFHPFPDDSWQVDREGDRRRMLCPRAPATLAYAERYYALLGEVLKPRAAWLDDDLRLGFARKDGCFCDNCLKAFNAAYGHEFTREGLTRILFSKANGAEDHGTIAGRYGVRREWLDFISASLAVYGRAARKGIDRTHPACVLGYQSVSSASLRATGRDVLPLMRALSGDGRVPTAIRIGSGCYDEKLEDVYDLNAGIQALESYNSNPVSYTMDEVFK